MNKLIVLLLGVFTAVGVQAQQVYADSGNHGLMTITTKKNDNLKDVQGSPYMDENYVYGTVKVEGKDPLKVFLRYDVFNENMEVKLDKNADKTYVLPLSEEAVYRIGPDAFRYRTLRHEGNTITGYFVEHYSGENYHLLEKPSIEITEAIKARTGYERDRPAEMTLEREFYIVGKDNKVENVKLKHRDVKKAFNSKEAKSYLKDNKIRSKQDLIAFVSYLDQQ